MKALLLVGLVLAGFGMGLGLGFSLGRRTCPPPEPALSETVPPVAQACDEPKAEPSIQREDEDRFSFGKVVSVAASKLTIREYDFRKDTECNATYTTTAETELGNISNLAELKIGDDVVLDYTENGRQRFVTTLVREEKEGAPSTEQQQETEGGSASGTLAALRAGKLVLRQRKSGTEGHGCVEYSVSRTAVFHGLTTLADLKVNDALNVEYSLSHGKRLVQVLTKTDGVSGRRLAQR